MRTETSRSIATPEIGSRTWKISSFSLWKRALLELLRKRGEVKAVGIQINL
jgi:hypothetical protein